MICDFRKFPVMLIAKWLKPLGSFFNNFINSKHRRQFALQSIFCDIDTEPYNYNRTLCGIATMRLRNSIMVG